MALTIGDMARTMMGKQVGERLVPHRSAWYRPKCWRCALGWLTRRPHMVLVPIYAGGALQLGILADLRAQARLMERLPFASVGRMHGKSAAIQAARDAHELTYGPSGYDAMLLDEARYLRYETLPEVD